jgi:hypothetical protein
MIQIVDTATEGLPSPRLPSKFRMWVNNNWVKNTEERLIYRQKPYTIKEYWTTFKWWLRSQYREQLRKEHNGRRY